LTDIVETIDRVLEAYTPVNAELSAEVVLQTDQWARAHATKLLKEKA
jgi:1-deoxy-D-xylulose-5-phosphate reductoisomerase